MSAKEKTGKNETNEVAPVLNVMRDYMRYYAVSTEGNDQKAVQTFKRYEAQEKVRRLQNELTLIKSGSVPQQTCDAVVGKKREAKYHGYDKWASLMLQWIAAAKK